MSGLYVCHIRNYYYQMFYCFSTLSFYLGLTTCSSTAEVSPTILLEYSTADGPFIILQVLVVNGAYIISMYCILITMIMNTGNQIISLPSGVQTSNVRLQWRSLLNAKWSLDNVRIGSDALLYYLQFEIQVGSCSSPPINGSESDHVNLEYYDGSSWSLLQNECLHPKCFLMVIICIVILCIKYMHICSYSYRSVVFDKLHVLNKLYEL